MIERGLSIVTGALVTYIMLLVLSPEGAQDYWLTAVVVGALASAIWPLIWLLMIRRRRQNKMDKQVAEEVAKQTGGQG
jgi:cell shape-determining protein MreD